MKQGYYVIEFDVASGDRCETVNKLVSAELDSKLTQNELLIAIMCHYYDKEPDEDGIFYLDFLQVKPINIVEVDKTEYDVMKQFISYFEV